MRDRFWTPRGNCRFCRRKFCRNLPKNAKKFDEIYLTFVLQNPGMKQHKHITLEGSIYPRSTPIFVIGRKNQAAEAGWQAPPAPGAVPAARGRAGRPRGLPGRSPRAGQPLRGHLLAAVGGSRFACSGALPTFKKSIKILHILPFESVFTDLSPRKLS